MNYDLAKQLKEAGYKGIMVCDGFCGYQEHKLHVIKFPTLSELIEACGDDLFRLDNTMDGWIAYENVVGKYFAPDEEKHEFQCSGSTPEEAVAKLWLELNK